MTERRNLCELLHEHLATVALNFLSNDPGIGHEATPDAIHDARVALRHARSYLRTFARLLERGVALSIRADLKWYAAYLGRVRDLDVLRERLVLASATVADSSTWPIIDGLILDARTAALGRLRDAEGVARYQTVLAHLELLSNTPLVATKHVDLAEFIGRPWRDFRGSVRALERPFDEQRLHEVRIRAKDLRYAAELIAAMPTETAGALAKSASAVQDRVGERRDAIGAAVFLEEHGEVLGDAAFLAGMLTLLERQRAAQLLEGVEGDLRSVARRFKRLRRELG